MTTQPRPAASPPSLTDADFHSGLAAVPGPALVAFGAPGCGACRHLRALLPQLEVPAFYVDVSEHAARAAEFAVFHLPALFLFVDGTFHAAIEAEATLPALRQAVAQAAAAPAGEPP